MAHQVESMAWAGEVPWHGLGTRVSPDQSPKRMLKAAGLDWEVELYPITATIDGKKIPVEDKVLLARRSDDPDKDKTPLSVVGANWKPTQNLAAFEFFNDFVESGQMQMHTAGSLKGGRRVWALAKVLKSFTILGRDKIEPYLLFSLPHIYACSIDIRFTGIRVVCNNTHIMAMAGRNDLQISLSHRKEFDPAFVKDTLGIARQKLDQYREAAVFLSRKQYKDEPVKEYFTKVFPYSGAGGDKSKNWSRSAQKAHAILETQPGHDIAPASWWNAFNAVTFTADHLLGRTADARLESAWYGKGRICKSDALELALEYAGRA